ncbi:MAG TPA: response regulator transcription factor [Opitutales bacterium]|nr:response regulator transcription factor [Opitutales bacterium]
MKNRQLLVVEDDANIRRGVVDILESEGYAVTEAHNGAEGLKLFKQNKYDLVLLDLMMPEMSGYDVCREIRKRDTQTPILILTAKSQEIDKVVGLELGADDYITKPFGVRELIARVGAALRRAHVGGEGAPTPLPDEFAFGRVTIRSKQFEAVRNGKVLTLTPRELKLIELFLNKPNEALSRQYLLDQAWGIDYLGTTRTLDQHIAQLRKKIDPDEDGDPVLVTVHGVGYRYKPPGEKK